MKRLLSLLTAAALVLSLVPAEALATGDTPEQEDTPVCVCTDKCTEGSVNADCAVCTADPGACQGKEAVPAPQNQETPKQDDAPETPVCTCSDKCAQDAVNAECLVCTADPSACQGKEAAPVPQNQEEPKQNQSESGAPEAPVCTCTDKCAEGAVNSDCLVCGADSSVCAGTETVEEPETPQVITVTDWSWVDTLPALNPEDGKLYLGSAVTEENLAGITGSLPQCITANGETIPVRWTYGSGIFTAALPEGYVLAEGANPLTVAVVVKDANPLPVTDTVLTIGGQDISSGDYWTTDSNGTLSKYDGSVQPQDHYIHFDGSTLALNNATITGGIKYSGSSLTIDLAGTNKVSDDDNAISLLAAETANLTIQGTGSLAVASTNQGYGIHLLSGDGTGAFLTVDTCTLTVDGNPGIYFSSNGGSVSASLTVKDSALVRSDGGIEANGTTAMDTILGTGIVFSGNKGTVYGHAILSGSLTLEKGETLTIPDEASLTVPSGVTLTNKGTITNQGALTNSGTVTNYGTITNEGTLTNNGTVTNYGTISGSVAGNPVVTIVSNVPYMENGQSKTCDKATLVTSSASPVTWEKGWYLVRGDVTISGRVTVTGDVKLILADGCKLTVNGGIQVSESNSLTIYGQSKGTGSLEATGGASSAGIGGSSGNDVGTITINGGTINATGGDFAAGIGTGNSGNGGTITINGGNITATGGNSAAGIGGKGTTLTGNIGYAIQASSISADTTNFNGIVYSGTTYQVYGDVTLTESLEIKAGETLNVPNGASLTIPDASMITGSGTVSTSGTGALMMEPDIPDITVSQEFYYTGSDLTQTILDAVSISAEKKVTLAGQQVTVHLISDGWTKALKEGTAVSAGTYTVQFTKDDKTIEKSVTVEKSGSTLEKQVSADKDKYTYGETITISAKPQATGVAAFSLTPPAENQMAVYTQDDTQISEAVDPDSNGTYTITLDSTKLGAGTHTLVAKFTGNGNLAAASQEITVIINKADPTVSIPTGLTAVIGSTLKDVTLPSGWAWKAPDTDVRNVGEHSFPAVFTPADTANYNTREVSLTVSVTEPDLSSAKITLGTALTYNGKEQTQTVTVTLDGTTLKEGVDYTISGNTGKDAGNYTLTVTGKGNYIGKTSKAWSIAKAELTITGVDVQSKTYDGTTAATVTGVSFKGLVNGEALAMGTDYTATADFDDASADTFKSVTGKVTLLSSILGKNYVLSGASFLTSGDISAAASKLSFKVDRTKPVKGQYITFSVTPQIKGDNRSFLQRVLGINAPKVEFWVNGTTKLGEVKVEEGKTSTFAYDTDKGGLKLGKNTITAEFTGDGNLKGCTESVVVYLHDSSTSAPTGDTSNIQAWTVVLAVSAVVLIGLGVGAVIYRKKKK